MPDSAETPDRAAFSWTWEREPSDPEGDHLNADEAIERAVRILAEYAPPDIREKAIALADAYRNPGGRGWWYA